MKQYPKVTAENVGDYAHIDDDVIVRDILDTELEIEQYKRVKAAEEEIAKAHPDVNERRMADFKARARIGEISQRQQFVTFLREIQAARASNPEERKRPATASSPAPVLDLMQALKDSLEGD
jgi:hypothetical protein